MKRLDEMTAKSGGYIPPTLNGGTEGTDWGNLLAVTPEPQLDPNDPKVTVTLRETQARYQEGLITYHQPGQGVYLHHYLTIKNTLTELVRGEQEQAIRELYAVLLHTSRPMRALSIRCGRGGIGTSAEHGSAWMDGGGVSEHATQYDGPRRWRYAASAVGGVAGVGWRGKEIVVRRAATYFGTVGFRLEMPSDTAATLGSRWTAGGRMLLQRW